MDGKQRYVLGNMLSVVGASIIAAACRNLETAEGVVLAVAAAVLFIGARMSGAAKGESSSDNQS